MVLTTIEAVHRELFLVEIFCFSFIWELCEIFILKI